MSDDDRDQIAGLARILRDELDLLVGKWEGGSAHVSAGKISDLAKDIAEIKAPTRRSRGSLSQEETP